MAFCGECGAEQQGTRFCPNCGAPQAAGVTGETSGQHRPPPVEEEERTVWEGSSRNLTSAASGGKLASCRYRLTSKYLYFDAGLISTTSEQVPLWAVRDIDVKQSLLQKARGVGDVVVHVQHSDYTGRERVDLRDIEGPADVRDQLNRYAHRERREHDQRQRTQWYGRGD
jgi:hypothetical protein